ncbi:MAG: polysaccharide pyruvyl transferase family protein [Desulfobulbaceae bacterium]|nr:polysaccharide pyruvyl transferase family protein [Desulfobulbaceae bacterium]
MTPPPSKNLRTFQDQDRSVHILPRNRCTGCGACFNACPAGALKMETNEDGFKYPQIESGICTNCGICAVSCPAVNSGHDNLKCPECYAVWANDEIRSRSSSGGAFTLLSEYVLEHGGYVCGAAFDDQWRVRHVLINTVEDLAQLRGSKYIQSDTGNIYLQVKALLDHGKMVLFSGCPCQVAGLNGFLGSKPDNLITVDIFCHCIASPGIWEKYLQERFPDKKPAAINFRDKEISGWTCTKCSITVNGKKHATNEYVRGFHRALYARESCEACQFSHFPRQGDFTIGDWWGINEFNPSLNDNKGTSLLLINNSRKQDAADAVKKKARLFEPVPLEYIGDNGHVKGALKLPENRSRFLAMLREGVPFSKALAAVMDEKYDIGIVGFWYGLNYGSVLTSHAIYRAVEKLGYSAIHLNKPEDLWSPRFADKNTMAARFTCKHSNVSARTSNFDRMNEHCRMFLVGSDTVWDPLLVGKHQPFFFLDFAASDKKKISYASSFGRPKFNMEDPLLRQYCHYACNRLDAVSVREKSGVALMKEEFGRDSDRVLDPVFLLEPDEYRRIAEGSDMERNGPYIFSNILGTSEKKIKTYKRAVQDLALPAINFSNANLPEKKRKQHPLQIMSEDSIENWLAAIDNAALVISDSFHATCFAIILNIEFITIVERHDPMNGRLETLLSILQLEDRLVHTDDHPDFRALAACPIDYDRVKKILDAEKERSLAWLRDALKTPNIPAVSRSIATDKIIAHFRREINEKQEQLRKVRTRLRPLDELHKVPEGELQKSAHSYLSASFILRQAFRMEYWRCRLILRLLPEHRRQPYHARIRAVKLAISLLLR